MPRQYVILNNQTIFKSRYGKWNLIKVNNPQERFVVNKEGVKILKFLFSGKSISEVSKKYRIDQDSIRNFLQPLLDEKIINLSLKSLKSLFVCFDINPPLDSLNILLTNTCNLYCVHCYVGAGKKLEKELSGDAWISIIKEAKDLGVFSINISGGEPLLHPDFWKIVKFLASGNKLNSNLNTNGTILKKEHLKILSSAFSSIQISIDGDNQYRHDKFRGTKGCFNKSIMAIRMLVDYGIKTNIAFSLSPQNFSSLDGVIKICKDNGVNTLNIGFVANIGRAEANNLMPTNSVFLISFIKKSEKLAIRKAI